MPTICSHCGQIIVMSEWRKAEPPPPGMKELTSRSGSCLNCETVVVESVVKPIFDFIQLTVTI